MNPQAAALVQAGLAAMKAGRFDDAVTSLQQAVGADPESYDTCAYLGAAYARQGNLESSRRAFGRAVQLNPVSAKARFNLASAHQMAGDNDAARTCYEAAIEIDPGYTQASDALAKLPKKEFTMAELAAPGGKMHLPGAVNAEEDDERIHPPVSHLTPEEISRLSMPGGHLHMMGAQATDDSNEDKG